MLQEGESSDSFGSYSSSLLPFISDSSCSTYMTVGAAKTNLPPQEALSIFNYWSCSSTASTAAAAASVLSFERGDLQQEDDCAAWIDAIDQNYGQPISSLVLDSKRRANHSPRLIDQDQDCFEVESGSCAGLLQSPVKEKRRGNQDRFGLIYPGAVASTVDGLHESIGQTASTLQKRQYTDACEVPSPKKQCGNTRKTKDKSSPSKDPQSIAAKNRRERISERLKVLQDLVPNGTKVDLVTMLEKAISYVKFLQLQVKVLAADEFWPAQGGKAPDISQVKEAIDAILCSQRDRRSCSKH